MITAKEIMTKDVVTVLPDTEIFHAAKLLLERKFNGLPVTDEDGRLIGVICQSDIIAQQKRFPVPSLFAFMDGFFTLSSKSMIEREAKKILALRVSEAMTPDPISVTEDTSLETIAQLMADQKFHTLPVLSGGRVVGVIGKEDVLRTIVS